MRVPPLAREGIHVRRLPGESHVFRCRCELMGGKKGAQLGIEGGWTRGQEVDSGTCAVHGTLRNMSPNPIW
jgi:hypothetical protein